MRNPPFSDVIPEGVDTSVANWGRVVEEAQKISIAFDHQNNDKPFTIVDLNTVRRLHTLWKECMPSVKPYYAVKCNNDGRILATLLADGCAFDCASQGELEQVFSLSPKADIIFAHPVKTRQAIRFAAKRGIHLMTFDTIEELLKMSECDSEICPVLRIQVSGFSSLIDLNEKFGADEKTSMEILRQAAEMNVPMAGISFHIGSGVEDYHPMEQTLAQTRKLIDYGREIGHPMEILDIGGGIIFQSEENLAQLGVYMEDALRRHFEDQKVKVIAEPGRFFVTNCQYAVAKVIGVSPKRGNEQEFNVYINDGVYGSFNFVMTEYREAIGYPLKVEYERKHALTLIQERNGTMVADIWGITACALDRIEKNRTISLLKEGDWLIYPNNGAYSNVLSTEFNGFPRSVRMYLDSSAESE